MAVTESSGLMTVGSAGNSDSFGFGENGISVSFSGTQPKGVITVEVPAVNKTYRVAAAQLVSGQTIVSAATATTDGLVVDGQAIKISFAGKCENLNVKATSFSGPLFSGSGHGEWSAPIGAI